jgi:hypothetical protein
MHRKNGSGGQARVRRGSGAPGRRLRHAFDGRPARCEMAAREEQLLLASPSKAISARMMQKQYMPTALLALDLPAGSIEASGAVPKFATDAERSAAERLEWYTVPASSNQVRGLRRRSTCPVDGQYGTRL